MSQLWQSRFQGQAPPSTTGWKVQKPPSAGVLRRDRSMARAWACSRVSGVGGLGEDFAGAGGAGTGDPDVLEDVFEVGLGQVDVVLGHPLGDLAEVAADVGQARPGPQQAGGQRVPGLVGDPAADVELVDPGLKPLWNHW